MKNVSVKTKAPAWALAAEKVFQAACKKAIQRHFKAGFPVHAVKDGKLVTLRPKAG